MRRVGAGLNCLNSSFDGCMPFLYEYSGRFAMESLRPQKHGSSTLRPEAVYMGFASMGSRVG